MSEATKPRKEHIRRGAPAMGCKTPADTMRRIAIGFDDDLFQEIAGRAAIRSQTFNAAVRDLVRKGLGDG